MLCKYIKQIEVPKENEHVEHKWAKMTFKIPKEKICKLNLLGIHICPLTDNYYLV
jgi:hypothetical protein